MINIATKLAKFKKKRNVSALPSLLEDIIEEKIIEEKEIKNNDDNDILNNNSIMNHFENHENFHIDLKDSSDNNVSLSSNEEIQLSNDFNNKLSTIVLNTSINKNIPDNGIDEDFNDDYENEFDIFDSISFSGSGFKLTGNTINQAVKSGSMIDVLRAVGGFNPSSYQSNQNENYEDFLPIGTNNNYANSVSSNTKTSSIDLFRQINNQNQHKGNANYAVNSFLTDDDDDFDDS
eukprot:CAMPEP_0196768178 /NCGR_PEP_ID=MMETSP1095-20130614/42440_1 /TAXON_ID=96789 ORGANISM="Chromulina nebulosa, Strain UTEXLB2642" /NCGR_SAMPLE_ID=MMETSP1095 /ASSEMBLY_ACC=CAM_ASM_000446 /LENGTH=233 /DNA_ID=CAMNT_0042137401 /DNA_START=1511 /DNA_END=2212 /DNA_ORIENTATION=+